MWQLELLSRVVPAFGALAKEYAEREHQDARLRRDAHDCYSDLASIGLGVFMSSGEWATGFIDQDVTKLLTALESRLPVKWSFPLSFVGQKVSQETTLIFLYVINFMSSSLRVVMQTSGRNFGNLMPSHVQSSVLAGIALMNAGTYRAKLKRDANNI
jgi:hypothetical protein